MLDQPNTQSWFPYSIAVQYDALIGMYDKLLLNPPVSACCLLYTFTFTSSIVNIVFSCFLFLPQTFVMIKINDQYPDALWID